MAKQRKSHMYELTPAEIEIIEKKRKRKEIEDNRVHKTEKYPVSKLEKDNKSLYLYVNGIRLLTVREYEALRAAIPLDRHKALFDVLIVTGMRYIEVQRLYDHPEWYNEQENHIHLPEKAAQKVKKVQLQRTIFPLPSMFKYVLKDFWNGKKPPEETTWNKNLRRWSESINLNPYGISAKTTRKTIESWMLVCGVPITTVCLRQGHDSATSMNHYQGLAFSDDKKRDIKNKLAEWNILR